jgi:hypothetical protein
MNARFTMIAVSSAAALATAPAAAREREEIALETCAESYGSIAVVDGDTQGWTAYGLGSPRELINSLAVQSGCFTPHSAASGRPADFLMNVIAGDKEEVDQGMAIARTAAVEGLVRSGAAGSVLSSVPMGGAVFGMLGGLGGRRKTVAAGIRLLSPANGQTLAMGTGDARQTTVSFGGGGWQQAAVSSGYAGNKNGKLMVEAFVKAFNALAAQGPGLAALMPAPQPVGPAAATVAAETAMRASPLAEAEAVRMLRAGSTVNPTGKREGLFVEVADNFGTTGWVSVEDLN